jgi:uncharacterized protein (DUF2147 family)
LPQIAAKALCMKRILAKSTLILLALTIPVTASAKAAIEGRWMNPRGSVVVRVAPCGDAYCGTVIEASAKAKESARKGGTPNLIGTQILWGMKPAGDGTMRGQVFDPKRNIRAPAIVRVTGGSLVVKGCLISGFICKEQRWTRVS